MDPAGSFPAALAAAPCPADPGTLAQLAPAVAWAIEGLESGALRVADPDPDHQRWRVHIWLKQAILLYFQLQRLTPLPGAWTTYVDKIPPRAWLPEDLVRVVPPACVRRGAFVGAGAVLMPCFVNIGAYVGPRTMVDTWATVGSCAQVGADVHLSGGVGLGGVLEPAAAQPVVVEDGAFIGSRAVVVEGVRVGARAILGAGVVLTASTHIVDVRGAEPVLHRGEVPAEAVVIPGTRPRTFAAGAFQVPCALIVGRRDRGHDLKTSLEAALRGHQVPV